MSPLRLYVCTDHDNHYPVGSASIVLAADEEQARSLLDEELRRDGLKDHASKPYTLQKVSMEGPAALILVNGNY